MPTDEQSPTGTSAATTPVALAGNQMSASLKERLRRLRRYSTTSLSSSSPTVQKQEKVTPDDKSIQSPSLMSTPPVNSGVLLERRRMNLSTRFANTESKPVDRATLVSGGHVESFTHLSPHLKRPFSEIGQKWSTNKRRSFVQNKDCDDPNSLKDQIKDRQEVLRKLKLVRLYREKNNLEQLESVISKWRAACQEALCELKEKSIADPKPTMTQLLSHLQLDHSLIRYNSEDDEFC